ncbi:hypothetical protein LTR85_007288 [Meristemomyces frigidus]|nr:hypothetical protein LTR85_007288 [Meristemomyces frigidus]
MNSDTEMAAETAGKPACTPAPETLAEWLGAGETHYAAHKPPTLSGGTVTFPLRSWPLDPEDTLAQMWRGGAVQLAVYNIIIDIGLITKWPRLIQRMVVDSVMGCDGARGVYAYLATGTGDAGFMVEVYNEAKLTDYTTYANSKAQLDDIGGEMMVSHLRYEVFERRAVLNLRALNSLVSIGINHMMSSLSGGRPLVATEEEPTVMALTVVFAEGTIADFDELVREYGELLRSKGLAETMQVRILEEQDLPRVGAVGLQRRVVGE